MRNLRYLTILFFFIACKKEVNSIKESEVKYSKIDSLKSLSEVENFIHKTDTSLNRYSLKKIKDLKHDGKKFAKIADSLNVQQEYYKGDFDNNGYKDLLVIMEHQDYGGMYCYAFLAFDKNSYKSVWINNRSFFIIPKIVQKNNRNFLEIHSFGFQVNGITNLLQFKHGGFIDFNPKPGNYNIENIELKSFDIRGKFYLTIDNNLNAKLKNEQGYYDSIIVKKINAKLEKHNYKDIVDLMNYMNFPNLKSEYNVSYTCAPISELKITYNGGKIKKIHEYGKEGTYSLMRLYEKFEEVRAKNLK